MASLEQFSANMRAMGAALPQRASARKRKLAERIHQIVVMATPVGNASLWKDHAPAGYVGGRARANWQVGLGGPKQGTVQTIDAGGGGTVSAGVGVISGAGPGVAIHITNNLPYIVPLNEGHSKQAPSGFIQGAIRTAVQASQAEPPLTGGVR